MTASVHRFRAPQGDNYQYALLAGGDAWVVDPFDGDHVAAEMARLGVRPRGILLTHTHWDHTAGVAALTARIAMPVWVHPAGRGDVAAADLRDYPADGALDLGGIRATVVAAPGHHPAHVWIEWGDCLVVGDILFLAGCGNPNFGGDVLALYDTVWEKLRRADPARRLAWGHDYADKNLAFAVQVDPESQPLRRARAEVAEARARGEDLPWRTLADELAANPFLRCDDAAVIAWAEANGAASSAPRDVFLCLRAARNRF